MRDGLKIFSGSSNPSLAAEIGTALDLPVSKIKTDRFSNDNLHVQILENVRERDVFVVQSFTQPVSDHIMELMIILDALRGASARRITAVVPYFSYARSDKKDAPRISITGRLMADLLQTAGANRVLTVDLHAEQVHGFFHVPVDHLTAVTIISDYFRQHHDLSKAVAVAADAGGAKRVGRFAERLAIPMAIIDKRRVSDVAVKQSFIVGEVAGRDAMLFDDEIATAGTLVASLETLIKAGAKSVMVGATHGVLCGPAIERLQDPAFTALAVTNTVAVAAEKQMPKLEVLSLAPLLAKAIRCIHTGESVGALFS